MEFLYGLLLLSPLHISDRSAVFLQKYFYNQRETIKVQNEDTNKEPLLWEVALLRVSSSSCFTSAAFEPPPTVNHGPHQQLCHQDPAVLYLGWGFTECRSNVHSRNSEEVQVGLMVACKILRRSYWNSWSYVFAFNVSNNYFWKTKGQPTHVLLGVWLY